MAFGTGQLDDILPVQGGERYGDPQLVLTDTVFEDGLNIGRFAKLDTGSIDNLDESGAPTIVGVVLRSASNAVEDSDSIDAALNQQVEYLREGLVTVDVVPGQTPAKFGAVSVHNVADANAGKALATGGVAVNAQFIQEVTTDVWLVYLALAS